METTLEALYKPIAGEMALLREAIRALWTKTLTLLDPGVAAEEPPGGKLLRPALCLLSAGAAGAEDLHEYVPLAGAFELLHMAALLHDDVVDRAPLRRGARSVNALHDDRTAVLGGDYTVALALGVLNDYACGGLMDCAVRTIGQMAEGELNNLIRANGSTDEADCIHLARQKTASLFAAACTGPTFLIESALREPLRRYGENFGIAFQLIDDVLDLCQDEAMLGKPSCGDIVEGQQTLPIMFMRRQADTDARRRLDAMRGGMITDEDRAWVAALLEDTSARELTEAVARRHAEEARRALDEVPDSPCRRAMMDLAEFVLIRGS